MDFIFYRYFYEIPEAEATPAGGESCKAGFFLEIILCSFFLYTILIQENISLHYLFIIKDIIMIRSKSHKII